MHLNASVGQLEHNLVNIQKVNYLNPILHFKDFYIIVSEHYI